MGRNATTARAYNYVVTGINALGQRFRLESNTLAVVMQITPWVGSLWEVAADGSRTTLLKYELGEITVDNRA